VTFGLFGQIGIRATAYALAILAVFASARAQSTPPPTRDESQGTIQGYVRDSAGNSVANATVSLESTIGSSTLPHPAQTTRTDENGAYHFVSLPEGAYLLRAERNGDGAVSSSQLNLSQKETKNVDLTLVSGNGPGSQSTSGKSGSGKPSAQKPDFFDEPQFTVAGVTQATSSGGHGSDTVQRTTEALAKATVSLNDASSNESTKNSQHAPGASEASLRDAVERDPDNYEANRQLGKFLVSEGKSAEAVPFLKRASRLNPGDAEVHHLLGAAEENSGDPLEAVREFERAAKLDPDEANFFDWGTELLTHRALQPAGNVFAEGNYLFPESVRMLVALGVTWYARGSNDQAAEILMKASDLAPSDPTPYLFIGKIQSAEINASDQAVERLARFAKLQPDNPLANYYYAVALSKQAATSGDHDLQHSARIESLLLKSLQLDPKLGDAYLQLGILYTRAADFSRAISAYHMAIAANPDLPQTITEAHYHLAQVYRRTGDIKHAQEQLKLHDDLAKKTQNDTERAYRAIQEFVVSTQTGNSASAPQP